MEGLYLLRPVLPDPRRFGSTLIPFGYLRKQLYYSVSFFYANKILYSRLLQSDQLKFDIYNGIYWAQLCSGLKMWVMKLLRYFPEFDFYLTIRAFLIAIRFVVGLCDKIKEIQYNGSFIVIYLNITLTFSFLFVRADTNI
jgi:hypothetical protein